jgi:hypothetical protein
MAARLKSMAQRIDLGRSPNLDATVAIEPDALHLVRLGAFPKEPLIYCRFLLGS